MLIEITPMELASLLARTGDDAPYLLDVREQWEWDLVHLPDSVHLPMQRIPSNHGTLPADRLIVAICHHGVRSLQVAHFLQSIGLQQVASLRGGIDAWSTQIDPTLSRY